jgi:hypothetical protein
MRRQLLQAMRRVREDLLWRPPTPEKLRAQVTRLVVVLQEKKFASQLAKQQLVPQRAAEAMRKDLLLRLAMLQAQRLQLAKDSPARRVRVRRC